MEAVGRLASGIAHDFRNLLMALQGCLALAERSLSNPAVARQYLEEARAATRRGARLTDQLLTFSRRKDVDRAHLRLQDVVRSSLGMLRPLLGEDIRLETHFARGDEPTVRANADELAQVVMNLAANARDALPNGGVVRLATRPIRLPDPALASPPSVAPGLYVELSIEDDGLGMSQETRARIFEPFYTTKAVGQGTGLGLATVYAIVRGIGGDVVVESQEGLGSRFRLFVPVSQPQEAATSSPEPGAEVEAEAASSPEAGGRGAPPLPPRQHRPEPIPGPEPSPRGRPVRVLLVEDDAMVRMTVRHYLEASGHLVLEAADVRHAMELVDDEGTSIDALVTDMVMPGMSGPELARYVSARVAELRVVFMSAHPVTALARAGRLEPGLPVLEKPFDAGALDRALTEARRLGAS